MFPYIVAIAIGIFILVKIGPRFSRWFLEMSYRSVHCRACDDFTPGMLNNEGLCPFCETERDALYEEVGWDFETR